MLMPNQIIGHRGAAAYSPENTLESFQKAKALGCQFVEFDVMLSADDEAFVFHDERLERTTNGRGEFASMPAEYLKSLNAGRLFNKRSLTAKIPTFQSILAWLIEFDMQANIEIKPLSRNMEKTTVTVLSLVNSFWPRDKALPLISSFNLDVLKLCHNIAPDMPLGFLMHEWQENWLTIANELKCFSVHLNSRIANTSRINAIKQAGFKVFIYTVNSKRQATKLLNLGVDAIFSDYPDLLTRSLFLEKILKKLFKKEKA